MHKRFSKLSALVASLFLTLPALAAHDSLLDHYQAVQTALAQDDLPGAKKGAEQILKIKSNDSTKKTLEGARVITQATDLKTARSGFGTLSGGVVTRVKLDPALQTKWKLYQCPMAKGYQFWLQPEKEGTVKNPYMGSAMQTCGMGKPWG